MAPSPPPFGYYREEFTPEETRLLEPFFTNTDLPVFGVHNLPEVVKGALFARYSRSGKSLRRLFLDEFVEVGSADETPLQSAAGQERAERLFTKVFTEYGDDSVAQLGAAHLACEQSSNLLTKVLERGRLASYLEQSTRYVHFDGRNAGKPRHYTPSELSRFPELENEYHLLMRNLLAAYDQLIEDLIPHLQRLSPKSGDESERAWAAALRAKALDIARGLLPVSTLSNVGIFASGQAYEQLLIRMFANPLQEVQSYGRLILSELRKLIPSFLTRVDLPERGTCWSQYLAANRGNLDDFAQRVELSPTASAPVVLVDWDPDAESKVLAAALYEAAEVSDQQLLEWVAQLAEASRDELFRAFVGLRTNRRHKPGRALERSWYRFDVLCDYGAFRDLQRHRMLTIEWQRVTTRHGYSLPVELRGIPHLAEPWQRAMRSAEILYEKIRAACGATVAQYVVPFAYRVRFVMQLNAREAFHMLELRSQPAGHAAYRFIAQEMHRLIRDVAGHARIARAMEFVDHGAPDLGRLEAERRLERRRAEALRAAPVATS